MQCIIQRRRIAINCTHHVAVGSFKLPHHQNFPDAYNHPHQHHHTGSTQERFYSKYAMLLLLHPPNCGKKKKAFPLSTHFSITQFGDDPLVTTTNTTALGLSHPSTFTRWTWKAENKESHSCCCCQEDQEVETNVYVLCSARAVPRKDLYICEASEKQETH